MIYLIKGSDKSSYFNYMRVDADYQKTLKFKMKEGRFFSDDKGSDANNIVINEAAAKILGITDFNQIVHCNNQNQDFKVIGIVNDFNMKSLRDVSLPLIMHYFGYENFLSLRIQPGDISQIIKTTKEDWEQFNNEIPFEYYFLDKAFDAQYKSETRLGKLIGLFTLIAILIGSMGLLGLVSFNTTNRVKEIGIRKINGAKISEILTMLNRDFIKWVIIAFVIATPIGWYAMNTWLESFAYKTDLSWWIFALAGLLALGIALLTVSWQSWKAATRNPVESLRYE
jgi:putative ABC transport system permease protein